MSTDSQTLVAAVKTGEMTDPGGMTTTQDITHAVEDSYSDVEQQLRALADEDLVERKIYGKEEVWVVPEDSERAPAKTPMPTDTRDPHAGE